jgi:hypothetical protein
VARTYQDGWDRGLGLDATRSHVATGMHVEHPRTLRSPHEQLRVLQDKLGRDGIRRDGGGGKRQRMREGTERRGEGGEERGGRRLVRNGGEELIG